MSTTLDTLEKVKAIYGGTTWTKIEGKFLLGANSSYVVNSTGGSASNSHTHTINSHSHGLSAGYTKIQTGAYLGQMGVNMVIKNTTSWKSTRHSYAGNGGYDGGSDNCTEGAALGGTTDGSGALTSNTPSDTNNMPPYKAVYIWERTA